MKGKFKGKIAAFVAGALVTTAVLAVGVIASGGLETITAYLNKNVKISFKNEIQTFTDADGNVVYPITYEGTTYLPVRAVAGLVDLSVGWNADTNTVELGFDSVNDETKEEISRGDETQDESVTPGIVYIAKYKDAEPTRNASIIKDKSLLTVGEHQFNSGVEYKIASAASASESGAMFLPTYNHNTLEFTVYATKDSKIYVLGHDYEKIAVFEVEANQFVTNRVNISGIESVAFLADTKESVSANVPNCIYFFDPLVYSYESSDKDEDKDIDVYLVDYKSPKAKKYLTHSWVIRDKNTLSIDNERFKNGVGYEIWNGQYSTSRFHTMHLPMLGYNTIKFTVYTTVDAEVVVYDENNKEITTFTVSGNTLVTKEIDVNESQSVALQANAVDVSVQGYAYFFEPTASY